MFPRLQTRFSIVVLVTCLVAGVASQLYTTKTCPFEGMPVQKNFYPKLYLGKWYINRMYVTKGFWSACYVTNYYDKGDGIIGIRASYRNTLRFVVPLNGEMKRADPSNRDGLMTFTLDMDNPLSDDPAAVTDVNLRILGTDYDSYAVLWQCDQIIPFLINRQRLWILTRDKTPPKIVVDAALKVADERNLDTSSLVELPQTCPN